MQTQFECHCASVPLTRTKYKEEMRGTSGHSQYGAGHLSGFTPQSRVELNFSCRYIPLASLSLVTIGANLFETELIV